MSAWRADALPLGDARKSQFEPLYHTRLNSGARGQVRTAGLWIRNPALCPTGLRARTLGGAETPGGIEPPFPSVGRAALRGFEPQRDGKPTLALPAGIEPATPGLEDRCSLQLSYGSIKPKYPVLPGLLHQPDALKLRCGPSLGMVKRDVKCCIN